METQDQINYKRIEQAIHYIKENYKQQPSLEEIAAHVNVSPAHFQRLFSDWAGTSPKKFLQYISIDHAKRMLKEDQASLFDTTFDLGLGSTSRLHDLFIKIEGMSPAEYKNGGENLHINYNFAETKFGSVIIASTEKGICYLAFSEEPSIALENLKAHFSKAHFSQKEDKAQQQALSIFSSDEKSLSEVKLHLKGTDFQLKVWESLLKIPLGKVSTYGKIATEINKPSASRAVGTAIGSNPVAFLIPCHRVIQSTGAIGGYMWGPDRKSALLGWEAVQLDL